MTDREECLTELDAGWRELWLRARKGRARGVPGLSAGILGILMCGMLSIGSARVLAQQQPVVLPPAGDGIPEIVRHYTLQTYVGWFNACKDTKPDFKPGDVLRQKDLSRIRCFVPPGFYEQLNFADFRMEVAPPEDLSPNHAYKDCTEKYAAQTKLAPDGSIPNYVCGQPFPTGAIKVGDPTSGIKAAWNYNWRPRGWMVRNLNSWVMVRPGGSHELWDHEQPPKGWFVSLEDETDYCPPEIGHYYGGGGTFERIIEGIFQLSQYSHIAEYMDTPWKGALPVPSGQEIEFKEWDAFFRPYDIRGTAFIQYRYLDPHRPDNSWAYVPVLRRVRRISTEVKSDSLLGTDFTLDDFWGFNARVLDWKWEFLGWMNVLATTGIHHDFEHYYGPMGTIPDDWYRLRRVAVVIRRPKFRHPYTAAVMLIDPDNFYCLYHFPIDVAGHLWKTNIWGYRFSEDTKRFARANRGMRALDFNSVVGVDVQHKHASIIPGYAGAHPRLTVADTEKLFDPDALERLHR